MTATDTATGQSRPAPRARKPQGQWKVDGREPLNHNEEFKAEDDALNVRERILDTYSKDGFASIPPDDLSGRFRWWGLYTQRMQGIDGAHTSKLEADELQDEYFMMRVRLDGGAVTTGQLRVLAGVSRDFARDSADISDRQNIQYHWIRVEDVPEIWRRLEDAGMSTVEACGDCPRVVLGSPVAGIAADEIIDPTPVIEEITRRFIGSPEFSNLPRKFKSAVTGHPSLDVVHEINDISLVGVVHPELGPGYDLWVGGGLSTNPQLAQRLGVFVAPEKAADVWAGVIGIFRDYGYRRQRTRARLKFLVKDWGVERFREVLETEYLGEVGLHARPSSFRRATMACTGIEYCKLAFVETKGVAATLVDELEGRFADEAPLETPISVHLNGCPNSCARIQTADIGLKGQLLDGDTPGFQVHLGGGLASADRESGGLGRTVRGLRVASAELPDYVERVIRNYLTQREGADESFATWAHRAEEESLT